MTQPFVHNVSEPDLEKYHRPDPGGFYGPRYLAMASDGQAVWLAWHGYEGESGLDRVWAQAFEGESRGGLIELTDAAGLYGRPAAAPSGGGGACVAWCEADSRIVARTLTGPDAPQAGPLAEIAAAGPWRRELAMAAVPTGGLLLAAVSSEDGSDRVELFRRAADEDAPWQPAGSIEIGGVAGRCDVIISPAGRGVLACDAYRDGAYEIRLFEIDSAGAVRPLQTLREEGLSLLQPRLCVDAAGTAWMCCLQDRYVQREGVVSRSDAVRVFRDEGEGFETVGDGGRSEAALLYTGLLPKKRYFGYSGLRRNPFLVAADDGSVHLLWEAQRSEEEEWANLANGYLLHRRFGPEGPGPVSLLYDGGCCFAADGHAIQPAGELFAAVKGEHREAGDDFYIARLRPASAVAFEADDPADWPGWQPLAPVENPLRGRTSEIDGQEYVLLFGDLHNHSCFSADAEAWPDELYHFARDAGGVDFSGITDNDFYPEKPFMSSESLQQRLWCRRLDEPGGFTPFAGYERTYHAPDEQHSYNHRSILFAGGEDRIVRRNEPDGQSDEAFRRAVADHDLLIFAHHGQYDLLGIEAGIEVTSGWAVNIEKTDSARRALSAGSRVALVGASDGHRAVPGLGGALLGVWAKDRSREAIVEAIRARRCFATAGTFTAVDFRVSGAPMGAELKTGEDTLEFFVEIEAPEPITRVTLIEGGAEAEQFQPDGKSFRHRWTRPAPAEATWYFLRIEMDLPWRDLPHNVSLARGPWAWTSPIWVDPK